ncbi:MAG: AAA family ATPase [Oscillospiraceae bacterium]|jgi:septum site-determining protein MinD
MGTITMFASGRDGVGKSTVSVFTAAALADKGKEVLLIELDSGLRSIDIMSGLYSNLVYDLSDVLDGRCETGQAIMKSPLSPHLSILSAPFKQEVLSADRFLKLCTVLDKEYDFIILDTAAVSSAIITAASSSMSAVIVTTPDPISIRASRVVADSITDLSVNNIRLVINRLVPSRVQKKIIPNLDYCIDAIGARLLGVVPESDEIALACAGHGQLDKSGIPYRVFSNIADRMLGSEVPPLIE